MNQGSKILENMSFNRAIEYIGGKWKMQILWSLVNGPLRFTALKDTLSPITQKMLATALKELEADGLVHRQVFSVVPPKVEYSLTPLFGNLKDALEIISQWGEHIPESSQNIVAEYMIQEHPINTPPTQQSISNEPVIVENKEQSSELKEEEAKDETQEEQTEHHQKRESFFKKNDKPSRISNLFK